MTHFCAIPVWPVFTGPWLGSIPKQGISSGNLRDLRNWFLMPLSSISTAAISPSEPDGLCVPGGTPAESEWKDLVGVSPASPGEFITRLLAKDDGWLAAYFDALSRVSQKQQPYFTESHHLRNFYEALRGKDLSPSPTRHSFRPDQGLFLLVNRLQLEANGQPHIPGGLEVWKEAMRAKSDSKMVREWGKRASGWNNPEQLMEGMFALSRVSSREGPLNSFLALSEIDRGRSPDQRLNVQTARLLADRFSAVRRPVPDLFRISRFEQCFHHPLSHRGRGPQPYSRPARAS